MISERTISRSFESVWKSHFPMLNSRFMLSFNRRFTKPITDAQGAKMAPVPPPSNHPSPDLAAEFGIQIAKMAIANRCTSEEIVQKQETLNRAWESTLGLINRYEGRKITPSLKHAESYWLRDSIRLSSNLCAFIEHTEGAREFGPILPGTGFIPMCEADLSMGCTLVEIKTVSRGFSSQDLKQVLIYLALDWASGKERWNRAALVNPRRACCSSFGVDWLVRRTSGRSCSETFGEFIDSFHRDSKVEAHF